MPRHSREWLAGVLPVMLWLASASASGLTFEAQTERSGRSGGAQAGEAATLLPGKPAWQWTTEERIARRFNPEAMKARVAEQQAEQRARRKFFPKIDDGLFAEGQEAAESIMDTLDGRQHPEVFFPDELFVHLLNDAFPPGGEYQSESRRPIEERAVALGFGRDLWPRLEKAAAPLMKLEADRERQRPVSGGETKMDDDAVHLCRVRAGALAAAKAEFGEKAFLRLLYEAVAPGVTLAAFGPGLGPGDVDQRRYNAGGCP